MMKIEGCTDFTPDICFGPSPRRLLESIDKLLSSSLRLSPPVPLPHKDHAATSTAVPKNE